MPKENKKRGRWAEKKRKRDEYEQDQEQDHGNEDLIVQGDAGDDFISFSGPTANPDVETPFYGLLDQQEQEYYANVNAKLELNDFESAEDRALFLDAVYRESRGKELKIASSQSCSRYLERVVRVSNVEQVRALFGKFGGHFLHLVQHRFASHCCEALFLKAAEGVGEDYSRVAETEGDGLSLEQLFLTVVDELEPNLGYLLMERFASHVVRVLLLVLSGQPLNDTATNSVLASRKKEKIEAYASREENVSTGSRHVPQSFNDALNRLISSSVSSLDTTYIRALATHPIGNPILQLLLRLELLQSGKSKAKDADSVIRKLLPDESLAEDTESAKFVEGLLFDPTGSRLLETIIQHAPGKMFKKLYGNLLRPRIGAMSKNDSASYVTIRILERLSKEDLQAARDEILPEIPTLVARNRLGVIRGLVERCNVRHVDLNPVISALQAAYDGDASNFLLKLLKFDPDANKPDQQPAKRDNNNKEQRDDTIRNATADIHGSLLAQSLLQNPTTFPTIHQSLLSLPTPTLLQLSTHPSASRVLQQALTSPSATPPSNRQLIPRFRHHMASLAMDPSGSHLADALWHATSGKGLHFLKEQLAQELVASEAMVRGSRYGRTVWRNWEMDLFLSRGREWQMLARGGGVGSGTGRMDVGDDAPVSKKSKLEIARQRFAAAASKRKGYHGPPRSNVLSADA